MDFRLRKCCRGQSHPYFGLQKRCSANRLASLPDELLCQILSSLPTKDAVVASLSFRNMRAAFTRMTSLDFDDSPITYCARVNPQFVERFQSFKMFVDHVLKSSLSPRLSSFRLRFGGDSNIRSYHFQEPRTCGVGCFPDLEPTQLDAWIGFPLSRCGVREIDLCIYVSKPGKLPSAFFACETLEMLKIDTNLDFELVSAMTSFSLPNLKVLKLCSLLIAEHDFVTRLISSCPLLEDLHMECWTEYGTSVTVSSPSLKRLNLEINRKDEHSDLICIDTPNLQYLKYTDFLAVRYSVTSMKALTRASFHLWDFLGTHEESFDSMLSLLRVVSNVQHLSLQVACVEALENDELKNQLPMFPNLTYLKLGDNRLGKWDIMLFEFLQRSPRLESLGFPRGLIYDPEVSRIERFLDAVKSEQEFFRTNQVTPPCCKSSLKRIFIKKCWGSERELELIGFLLKIALVLEELLVVCHDKVDKPLFESMVKQLPRASSTCLIIVH